MGRHHHLKLPDHLYLSPPPQTPPSYFYLSFTSTYASSAALFSETSSNALAVGDRIPGFKTSAAFLNSLRANLNLDIDSAPPSLTNTPDSLRPVNMASSTGSLPPPSPLANPPAASSELSSDSSPLAGIPDLTTKPAISETDRIDGLKLIADSVAQQRQMASNAIIFHPITIAVWLAMIAVIGQLMYDGSGGTLALIGTTSVGLSMAILISVRWAVSPYIAKAEDVGTWKWLDEEGEKGGGTVGNEMLLTRFGDEAVGSLILRGVRDDGASPTKKSGRKQGIGGGGGKNVKGVIRGWSVKRKYRHKGLGTALLEDVVKLCQAKGWSGPVFSDEHANSGRVLPALFNGGLERREKLGRALLEKVIEESGGTSNGRRGKK